MDVRVGLEDNRSVDKSAGLLATNEESVTRIAVMGRPPAPPAEMLEPLRLTHT